MQAHLHREGGSDARLTERLGKLIDALPVLPAAVTELMALDRASPRFFDGVKRIVELDPGLAVRVLSAANSAASAPRAPITALSASIMRIGSTNAADLVLAAAVTRVFRPKRAWQRDLWRHALSVAVCARAVAGYARGAAIAPDEAYAAALLHDVGRFVLMLGAPAEVVPVEEGEPASVDAMLDRERALFGVTHTDVGEMTCARWRLPNVICHVVREHHAPVPSPRTREDRLSALVALADTAMPRLLAEPVTGSALQAAYEHHAVSLLDVSWSSFEAVLRTAQHESDAMSQALGLGAAP
jgi:HD-like signal output (HDOD) protein